MFQKNRWDKSIKGGVKSVGGGGEVVKSVGDINQWEGGELTEKIDFLFQVSNLILKNHQLSPYKKEEGLESVSICEDLLALATAVANVAKANAALLHDQVWA